MSAENSAKPVLRIKNKGGAPRGNRNALKHGAYTAKRRALMKRARATMRYARALCDVINRGVRENNFAALTPLLHRPNS